MLWLGPDWTNLEVAIGKKWYNRAEEELSFMSDGGSQQVMGS